MNLAAPIILASLSQTLMSLIDIAMVGRLGAAAVAAVGLASMFTFAISDSLNAIQAGVQTVVARREGEGRPREAGEALRSTHYFALVVGSIAGLLFVLGSRGLLPLINPDADVVAMGLSYILYRGPSLGLVMMGFAFYGFYNGISRPRIHLLVSVVANTLNVVLNYGLIFGHLGMPAMGVGGAGLATTISSAVAVALYALATRQDALRRRYPGIWRGPRQPDTLGKILRLSLPAGIQHFGVMAGFAAFMTFMGWVSTVALAATEIVINILSFSFMPATGFLFATQTLVSKSIGEGNFKRAEDSVQIATLLCLILMGSMGLVFIAAPRFILGLFTPVEAIVAMGVLPLQILGLVQFADAVGMVNFGALRGAGDNVYPAVAEIMLMWLFLLPVTWFTAIHQGWGINAGWTALAAYIVIYAATFYLRFRRGPWRRIVI